MTSSTGELSRDSGSNLVSPTTDASATSHKKIHIGTLPDKYRPGHKSHSSSGRLVVVGDVHGQLNHLEALLAKIKFDRARDHLVLAGDMIAKGPDSAGVIDLLMDLGASAVRGNHEERIIGVMQELDMESEAEIDSDEDDDVAFAKKHRLSKKRSAEKKLVKKLGSRRMHWLQNLPVILKIGNMGKMGEVIVVHAGLVPGVELPSQDPEMVMNMRSMHRHGKPSMDRDGIEWTTVS